MAAKEFSTDVLVPQNPSEIAFEASPTALDGTAVLQVTYDDATFTSKEELAIALQRVKEKILDVGTTWPPA